MHSEIKKITVILFLILQIYIFSYKISPFPALLVSSSIVGSAMGDIRSITNNAVVLFNGNPALYNRVRKSTFYFQHFFWYNSTYIDDVGFVDVIDRYRSQAFGVRTILSPKMTKTTINTNFTEGLDYNDLGTYRFYNILVSYAYSKKVSRFIDGGVNVKFLLQSIDEFKSYLSVFDVGLLFNIFEYKEENDPAYAAFIPDYVSLSFNNYGPSTSFQRKKYSAPFIVDVGAEYRTIYNILNFLTELEYVSTLSMRAKVGIKLNLFSALSIRTGYLMDFNSGSYSGLTFGMGINTKYITINYSLDLNSSINLSHKLQVQMRYE